MALSTTWEKHPFSPYPNTSRSTCVKCGRLETSELHDATAVVPKYIPARPLMQDNILAEPCPRCDGEGKVKRGRSGAEGDGDALGMVCPKCQGTGRVVPVTEPVAA